jgi:hypothetical protein
MCVTAPIFAKNPCIIRCVLIVTTAPKCLSYAKICYLLQELLCSRVGQLPSVVLDKLLRP